MNNKEKLRDQLLSQEKTNPQYQKSFQLEVKKMYTEKLKINQRIAHVLASLMISFFILFFWAMAKMFEELQIKYELSYAEPLRLAFNWAMFLSVGLVVFILWPSIRGKVGLRMYPKIVRLIFWILLLVIVFIFFSVFDFINRELGLIPVSVMEKSGVFTMVIMVVIMGVYMMLSGRIDRGDMKNKAKTLELEHRIAELEEKLNQGK